MNEKAPPEYIANRYRLQEQLGKGGMGSVYRAHDEMLDRDIAIKFLLPRQNPIGASSERFLREARAVARLSHPNIMLLFDMGQQDDWYYLVLEHIPGTNLHRMIEEQAGPLSLIEALRIISETLKALGYAHAQGCIHRDIKPENIMVTLENEVKIADFGLALAKGDVRLTADDSVLGTALYMAPETTMGEDVDHRADLYAVGAVFYEMLTGQPPFDGDTAMQIMAHALHTPLTPPRMVNPSIPENLEDVVVKLLEKDPDYRYSSAQEALAALPDSADMEALINAEMKQSASERLSRSLLERIVHSPPDIIGGDSGDSLLDLSSATESETLTRELLVYAAHEDTNEAIEAERRNMAHLLDEQVISQLNLILSQVNAYERSLAGNQQARMALSVLSALIKQSLQQARDLESSLHPTVLETLGLATALESLAGQVMRSHGVQLVLLLQRLSEKLPAHIELVLFRAAQQIIDRAVRQAGASQITIKLERKDEILSFDIDDNGSPPADDVLRATRSYIEGLGGTMSTGFSRQGGLNVSIRFGFAPPVDLTKREMDVIHLLADGLSNKEIAALLYISPRTVKFHLDNIYSKLGVNSRTEAAVYALRQGWVSQKHN